MQNKQRRNASLTEDITLENFTCKETKSIKAGTNELQKGVKSVSNNNINMLENVQQHSDKEVSHNDNKDASKNSTDKPPSFSNDGKFQYFSKFNKNLTEKIRDSLTKIKNQIRRPKLDAVKEVEEQLEESTVSFFFKIIQNKEKIIKDGDCEDTVSKTSINCKIVIKKFNKNPDKKSCSTTTTVGNSLPTQSDYNNNIDNKPQGSYLTKFFLETQARNMPKNTTKKLIIPYSFQNKGYFVQNINTNDDIDKQLNIKMADIFESLKRQSIDYDVSQIYKDTWFDNCTKLICCTEKSRNKKVEAAVQKRDIQLRNTLRGQDELTKLESMGLGQSLGYLSTWVELRIINTRVFERFDLGDLSLEKNAEFWENFLGVEKDSDVGQDAAQIYTEESIASCINKKMKNGVSQEIDDEGKQSINRFKAFKADNRMNYVAGYTYIQKSNIANFDNSKKKVRSLIDRN